MSIGGITSCCEQFNMKSERAETMYSTYPESVTDENRASRKGECTNSQGKIRARGETGLYV
jgi:hypothetical protein